MADTDYNALVTIPDELALKFYPKLKDRMMELEGSMDHAYSTTKLYYLSLANVLNTHLLTFDQESDLIESVKVAFDELYDVDFITDEDVQDLADFCAQFRKCFPDDVRYVRYLMAMRGQSYWYATTDIEQAIAYDGVL